MSSILVRQAVFADLDDLANLFDAYRQFHGKISAVKEARDFLFDRFTHGQSVIFVAQKDLTLVGFVQLYPSFSSISLGRVLILNDLFVSDEARKQGVAKELIASAVTYAKQLGAVRLTLTTSVENIAAQSLYNSLGWQRDQDFYVYHISLSA